MAYFEGVGGSGGSIVVTCDSEFAGSTISCSDGTNTMTVVCPSVSPYEVEFMVSDSGTYEISATIDGTTYTTEVVVDLELEASLEYGFIWQRWVAYGGLDPRDYEDLADVFSDEAAVRRLMLVHASADYLIDGVTDNVDEIDVFTSNDTAMKWLGLCDYVCDGLTAITGVEAKLLASTYWERYLKDHVPKMTSDTAPYGEVVKSGVYSSYYAWHVFDGVVGTFNDSWYANSVTNAHIGYKFATPICVKKVVFVPNYEGSKTLIKNYKVQASNDGSTWVDFATGVCPSVNNYTTEVQVNLNTNNNYYLYYRLYIIDNYSSDKYINIIELQFYGRSLNVSVPVMTSNTAPYGTVNVSSQGTGYEGFRAFDDTSSFWQGQSPTNQWVSYGFINAPVIKKFSLKANNSGSVVRVKNFKLQASNVANFSDGVDLGVYVQSQNNNVQVFECDNNTPYKYYRIFVLDTYGSSNYVSIDRLQFYGVDYSEKEFEPNTTKKWLYDHGVVLEELNTNVYPASNIAEIGSENLYLKINGNSDWENGTRIYTKEKIDASSYTYLFVKFGRLLKSSTESGSSSYTDVLSLATWENEPINHDYRDNVTSSVLTPSIPISYLVFGLNITNINQEEYIGITTSYWKGRESTAFEMWLE